MIKLAIFDFDGTLVDSSRDILEAANKTLVYYGFAELPLDKVRDHIGEGFSTYLKHVAGERADDISVLEEIFAKFQSYYDRQLHKHTRFYGGFTDFHSKFVSHPERRVGVASNKPEYQIRIILRELGLGEEHWVEIFGGDRFEVKKPHPKQLFELMALAGVTPRETVMIGDSRADVEAAVAAGTHLVGVSFGYNSRESLRDFGAEHVIDHFDELLPLIGTLQERAIKDSAG